jgi:hypothetical protein
MRDELGRDRPIHQAQRLKAPDALREMVEGKLAQGRRPCFEARVD